MEAKIVYFEKPGQENTSATFDAVDWALSELDIRKVVLASTRGDTARYAMDRYKGQDVRLIIVPHQYGFGPGQRFPPEHVERARELGSNITEEFLHGLDRNPGATQQP